MDINNAVATSHILHRDLKQEPLEIVSGSGIYLTLSNGRQIIDGSAGPAVSCIGHCRPEITAAVTTQMNKISYAYSGSQYTTAASEKLASIILANKPGGLCKAIFVNSGSEATDAAIKLASQFWHERKQPQRVNIIARKQSYHGNTIGALCVSGHESRRELYSAWLSTNVSFVDPCYAYRGKQDQETDEEYVARLRKQFEDEIIRLGPETVSAFVAETVSGTTLGCLPAVPGYFKAIREVCDKYGILLILDEIMCGMGKTGTMHAWEQEGIRGPDIQTIGKALGGGFVPLSGVLLNGKIFEALARGSKGLAHGHTFQAHPIAAAAAVECQEIILRENILANVNDMGKVLEAELRSSIAPMRFVGDIRGRGLFWAVEFVMDKTTKKSFPISDNFCAQVVEAALEMGLNILGNLGKTGFYSVEHVIISPPYIVTEDEIKVIVKLLGHAIKSVTENFFQGELSII